MLGKNYIGSNFYFISAILIKETLGYFIKKLTNIFGYIFLYSDILLFLGHIVSQVIKELIYIFYKLKFTDQYHF